jgi:protein tyrosine phosphatase
MQFELSKVGIAVETSAQTIKLTPNLSIRSFKLTDTDLGITGREIRQLHYDGWPDHGVPSGISIDSFVQMFEIFTYMLLTSESTEKAIVHCSAGIGRTGTTIGLTHLLVSLWAQKN